MFKLCIILYSQDYRSSQRATRSKTRFYHNRQNPYETRLVFVSLGPRTGRGRAVDASAATIRVVWRDRVRGGRSWQCRDRPAAVNHRLPRIRSYRVSCTTLHRTAQHCAARKRIIIVRVPGRAVSFRTIFAGYFTPFAFGSDPHLTVKTMVVNFQKELWTFVSDPPALAKLSAVMVLGLGSVLLSVLPVKRLFGVDPAFGSPFVALSMCFSGGMLLYTTMVQLQPDVRNHVIRLQHDGQLPDDPSFKNLGDLIFCTGFFVVFLIDDIVHAALDRAAAKSSADSGGRTAARQNALRRSMSLRRRNVRRRSQSTIPRPSFAAMPSDVDDEYGMPLAIKSDRFPNTTDEEDGGGGDGDEGAVASFSCLFAVLGLSFHEVFAGLVIGMENNPRDVWSLTAAVATRKMLIAFCVGLELVRTNTRRSMLFLSAVTFAVVTPVGIATGALIGKYGTADDGRPGPETVVLQGLAAGTLLYVVFFEVLARHKQSGFLRLLFVIIGFVTMFALQTVREFIIIFFTLA